MQLGQRQDQGQRAAGIGFVVLLHVAIVYLLVAGLSHKTIELLPPPIETKILQEIHPKEPPPPPPPLKFTPPVPTFVPPPEIVIQQPPPPAAIAVVTTQRPLQAPAPVHSAAANGPAHVPPVIDAKRNCREPDYPPASLRMGESGTVTLAFMIGTDGKVVESKVQTTSGFARLDEAARNALSRCKFTPGSFNGVPEQAWASMKYTWQIPE